MDVDGAESQPKRVSDYGIEVDFDLLEEDEREVRRLILGCEHALINALKDSSQEKLGEFESQISKLNGEIERMAPNMKAIER
jgi:structural maintenance of chromosome 1